MKVYLVISQIFYLLTLPVWLVFLMVAFMGFDSGAPPVAIVILYIYMAYPVVVIVLSIVSWVCIVKKKPRAALVTTSIPSLWVVVVTAFFIMISSSY
ncbi:hypothetical protein NV379_22870 [Paenibacillus sp. N1-5-1-14]|uniref:hypothetical protein n=1 Tax=Paenibacillus radicibacter TaxID=2972488 RepID=UPI002158C2BE|nr:hypothetical protein [Paenibacillus radicibacter]MCR8645484.1 hypothetical protein [Paenibacillus radicibacter]